MIKETIAALVEGRSLTYAEASSTMQEIMEGAAAPAQMAAFLTALRLKGETVDEIAGLASVMREKATPVKITGPAIDIVGTGGDGSGSFNISTAAAFVAAGAGLSVAKHGNRAATSKSGSADVLEALGVKIDLPPEAVARCVETVGIGFMFAPAFHPAMKHVAPVRREIGIRTVFNILGPLTNPARVDHMLLGVPGEELGNKIAAVLHRLGTVHSLVVHGKDGLDEISISETSLVWEITGEGVASLRQVSPKDFGFRREDGSAIAGGTPQENAVIMKKLLDGEKGPLRNAVIMNAAAALMAADVTGNLGEAAAIAEESIDSGRAAQKMAGLIELSQRLGER